MRFLAKSPSRNPSVNTVSAAYFRGRWVTRFSNSGVMDDFQVDGATPVRIPMMQQDNYPVKMGDRSDPDAERGQHVRVLPDEVTSNMTLLEDSLTAEFVQSLSMTLLPAQGVPHSAHPEAQLLHRPAAPAQRPGTVVVSLIGGRTRSCEKISGQATKLTSVNHKVVMETAPEATSTRAPPRPQPPDLPAWTAPSST
ncbi:unnamed protein product [Pleuronectes platessa]|uniref:Serpin domain-containing protein n=1 Tax=Pleuronectes platessa TaxID=8262 RepID=A0A9N7UVZ9_PLEPL|nr:unnamed protein product [Pleuronectes platessa]